MFGCVCTRRDSHRTELSPRERELWMKECNFGQKSVFRSCYSAIRTGILLSIMRRIQIWSQKGTLDPCKMDGLKIYKQFNFSDSIKIIVESPSGIELITWPESQPIPGKMRKRSSLSISYVSWSSVYLLASELCLALQMFQYCQPPRWKYFKLSSYLPHYFCRFIRSTMKNCF